MSTKWLSGGAAVDDPVRETRRARAREGREAAERSQILLRRVRQPDLEVNAPPFSRNPSAWSQRVPIALLAAVGFVISSYLALYQWGLVDTVYDPVFGRGTAEVLESDASRVMHRYLRMPDAALGALAYLGDALFGLSGSTRRWQYRPWMVILFGIDVIPLGIVSAILVVMQGTVVGAWCFLCLCTAVISLVLVPLAYDEVWATLKYLRRVHRASGGSWRVSGNAFLGRPSAIAEAVALEIEPRRRERRT